MRKPPFADTKGIRARDTRRGAIQPALRGWIDALGQKRLVRIATSANVGETDRRIGAQRDQLLLSVEPIRLPPKSRPVRFNEQMQPATVADFVGLFAGFSGTTGGIRKRHRLDPRG
jgi:hypothetical protein